MGHIGPYELNEIYTGDARALADAIPDNSVDLIFTDPVYQNIDDYRWLAETAARVLKPDSACLVWSSIGMLPETLAALSGLEFVWQFIEYRTNEVKHRHAPGGKCLYAPLLWLNKGRFYLSAFTHPGATVFDPFTGGGTVPAVCKMLGRNYLAFEIDPATADKAQQRVLLTQPPLMVLQPEQMAMEAGFM